MDANEEEKSVLLDFFPCHCVKKYVARVHMRMRMSCFCGAYALQCAQLTRGAFVCTCAHCSVDDSLMINGGKLATVQIQVEPRKVLASSKKQAEQARVEAEAVRRQEEAVEAARRTGEAEAAARRAEAAARHAEAPRMEPQPTNEERRESACSTSMTRRVRRYRLCLGPPWSGGECYNSAPSRAYVTSRHACRALRIASSVP